MWTGYTQDHLNPLQRSEWNHILKAGWGEGSQLLVEKDHQLPRIQYECGFYVPPTHVSIPWRKFHPRTVLQNLRLFKGHETYCSQISRFPYWVSLHYFCLRVKKFGVMLLFMVITNSSLISHTYVPYLASGQCSKSFHKYIYIYI